MNLASDLPINFVYINVYIRLQNNINEGMKIGQNQSARQYQSQSDSHNNWTESNMRFWSDLSKRSLELKAPEDL